jgi:hypothetical protein
MQKEKYQKLHQNIETGVFKSLRKAEYVIIKVRFTKCYSYVTQKNRKGFS